MGGGGGGNKKNKKKANSNFFFCFAPPPLPQASRGGLEATSLGSPWPPNLVSLAHARRGLLNS